MRHIDEFIIHRFRGMREAKFEATGQINLLVGGTNSGKTSVLEALFLFCDPLNPRRWSNVSSTRETDSPGRNLSDRLTWLFPQEDLFPREDLFPHQGLFPGTGSVNKHISEGNLDPELLLSASGTYPVKNVSARYEKLSAVIKERIPRNVIEEDVGQKDSSSFLGRERETEGVKIEVDVSLRKGLMIRRKSRYRRPINFWITVFFRKEAHGRLALCWSAQYMAVHIVLVGHPQNYGQMLFMLMQRCKL